MNEVLRKFGLRLYRKRWSNGSMLYEARTRHTHAILVTDEQGWDFSLSRHHRAV